jgi:hypothetical protein
LGGYEKGRKVFKRELILYLSLQLETGGVAEGPGQETSLNKSLEVRVAWPGLVSKPEV